MILISVCCDRCTASYMITSDGMRPTWRAPAGWRVPVRMECGALTDKWIREADRRVKGVD